MVMRNLVELGPARIARAIRPPPQEVAEEVQGKLSESVSRVRRVAPLTTILSSPIALRICRSGIAPRKPKTRDCPPRALRLAGLHVRP